MRSPGFNLWLQIALGILLGVGALLARRGWYRTHGACQATAYLITVVMTTIWMLPVFLKFFAPSHLRASLDRADAVATAHAALGSAVLLLGGYVILVAATNVVPSRFRFNNYRRWMRSLLALWWSTILLGIWTYIVST